MSGVIKKQRASALANLSLFAGLTEDEREAFLAGWEPVQYEPNYVICREGDPSTDMVLVCCGTVELYSEGTRLGIVGPFELVGEMGLLTEMPRSATVMVSGDGPVAGFCITRRVLNQFMFSDESGITGQILRNIIGMMAEKIRQDNERFKELSKSISA